MLSAARRASGRVVKVRLITVSQRQPRWVLEGCAEYEKRLPRAWQFELLEVKPEPRTSGADLGKVRRGEAARIRQALPKLSLIHI